MTTSHAYFYVSADDPPSKQAILRAALKLFVRDGYSKTNIRVIAEEAGYTNPALFKFFKSKEELGLYLFEKCFEHYAEMTSASIHPGRSLQENLDAISNGLLSDLEKNIEAYLFLQDHLREFWPLVRPSLKKKSILHQLSRLLVENSQQRDEPFHKMTVTALTGFWQQFARMLYFGELKGPPTQWRSQMQDISKSLIHRKRG